MNEPQITVLMAVFNGGQYLRRSIQSVLDQSFGGFELLIINDASTDDTLATINSFQDSRIQVWSNEKNMGQSRSLNKGLNLARGKYVARVDADDFAYPQWLKEQFELIEKSSDLAVLSTGAVVVDEHGRIRRIYDSPVAREDIILRSFMFSPINHVGCIFNKETVVKAGGYVEAYKIAADFGLWSNLIRQGRDITSNRKTLMAIRAHSSSLSRSASGAQELKDLSEIMAANINHFTDARISPDDSMALCQVFFDEGALNNSDFGRALVMINKVYGSLLHSAMITENSAQRWLKNRRSAAYLKRAFYFIEKEDYAAVKETLKRGAGECGLMSALGVLYMVHFLGKIFLDAIPRLSEKMMTVKAYVKTSNKPRMAGLL